MSIKTAFVAFFAIMNLGLFSQRLDMEFTFTAVNNAAPVQLDSIRVMNHTQLRDTVLYWPDTVLVIYNVGVPDIFSGDSKFRVLQNYPNPVADQTTISLYVPEKDKVSITVTDILGRVIIRSESMLDIGRHSFRFTPGSGNLYFFTARWQGRSSCIKILHPGFHNGGTPALELAGSEDSFPQTKSMTDIQDFFFSPGDELLYIGYADSLQSGIPDSPEESTTYTLQFATNITCPGTPTVEYEGQVYNTIQVFSQCWLKENLNVGEMIPGTTEPSNNGIIEKYCYNNEPDSCAKYGGLYLFWEMMNYVTLESICPPGWHVPSDEEWKVLEGAVDSQYRIGDIEWDDVDWRGYDAGTKLKTTSGWHSNGNGTDLFDFSAMPGGWRCDDFGGYFDSIRSGGYWWSSTERNYGKSWGRSFAYFQSEVVRAGAYKSLGYSVRCLKD